MDAFTWPERVHYAELKGPDALTALRAWAESLRGAPGFAGAEVLTSPGQPDLALVASRWAGTVPALDLPVGARGWAFEIQLNVSPEVNQAAR